MLSSEIFTSTPAARHVLGDNRGDELAKEPICDDERKLLNGMLADDDASWREFNLRYARLIYRCITRVTSRFAAVVGPDDVREIYAMLCVQLLANDKKKLRSFEPGRGNKLGSW